MTGADPLERAWHTEAAPRHRLTFWWESIWFALFRVLARYVTARLDEQTLLVEGNAWPERTKLVEVWDETEEEYLDRLRGLLTEKLAPAALPSTLPSVASVILSEPTDDEDDPE